MGIISTPIIWPLKQRPVRFSKNSVDENPERKNTYSLFFPVMFTSAASEKTSKDTLAAFTEKIDLDNIVMNQLPNENISNYSRSSFHGLNYSRNSFHGTSDAAVAVTEPSLNIAVPFLQSRSPNSELAQTLADHSDSESAFRSPVNSSSSSTAYEPRNETMWISSSNSGTSSFMHLPISNNILEPVSWWSETVFHHHITSHIPGGSDHSLSRLSISLTEEKSFQKTRLNLLGLAPENFYLETTEGNAYRKNLSMLAASSEFQSRKSTHIKEHHSGGITNFSSVETPRANSTSFFQYMNKTNTRFMPDIQLTNSVLGHSREPLTFSTPVVRTGWTSSALKHVVTTVPVYQQPLTDMYLESDSVFISSTNYWSHYLKHSVYFQKPSETVRSGVLENNLDAFHDDNENEELGFSILEPENTNRVGSSWDSRYLDFPTKYVDISPSLTASFWSISYHLKEAPQVFFGELSENWWLSLNKLLFSPTERLPSVSSPAKSDSISEQTSAIRSLGHRAEDTILSSHTSALETQIFNSFIPGLSKRISECNSRTISQSQSTMSFANLAMSSNHEFYFDFPFPSLEAPLSQPSVWVQVSPFDKVIESFTENLVVFDSFRTQIRTDMVNGQINLTSLKNRQQVVSVLPAHSVTQPSCSRDSQASFLINTPVQGLLNSTRTHRPPQSQSLSVNDALSNSIDKVRSKVQTDAGAFLKNISSMSPDFLLMTLPLEQRHLLHSDSKFRVSVPPNSYSTPPLPQSFQNHLDTISPSLIPQWNVAELSVTTITPRSHLNVLEPNYFENQEDSLRYSLWAAEQEITGVNEDIRNSPVLTSTNMLRLSRWDSEGEMYGSFSKSRGVMSFLNIVSTNALDFENADYEHFANPSSILESLRTAVTNDMLTLPSSYSGGIIQHKETILKGNLMTPEAAIHHSSMQSQTPVFSVMYHQSSVSSHVHSLANLPSVTSQNTTAYPPLNQLTSSPAVFLSCLCYSLTEMGCLCQPEVKYSMSSC